MTSASGMRSYKKLQNAKLYGKENDIKTGCFDLPLIFMSIIVFYAGLVLVHLAYHFPIGQGRRQKNVHITPYCAYRKTISWSSSHEKDK